MLFSLPDNGLKTKIIVGVVICVLLVTIAGIAIVYCQKRRGKLNIYSCCKLNISQVKLEISCFEFNADSPFK